MNEEITPLTEYIYKNRQTYTREAITAQLLSAGYKPEDIEDAWHAMDEPPVSGLAAADKSKLAHESVSLVRAPIFWLSMLGLTLASYGLGWALFSTFFGVGREIGPGGEELLVLGIEALGLLTAAVIIGFGVLGKNRALGMGLLIGALVSGLVLPLAALSILVGACMMSIGS